MTIEIPAVEPEALVIGDRWRWTREFADYSSADGWSVAYVLVNASAKVPIATTGSGTTYAVDVAPATTGAYAAGDYDWQAIASKGDPVVTDRAVLASGRITLQPGFATLAAGYDARSQARKAVDDLKAALATYTASKGHVKRYSIGDREMEFKDAGDIVALLNYWQGELAREERAAALAAGLGDPRRIYVRFGR